MATACCPVRYTRSIRSHGSDMNLRKYDWLDASELRHDVSDSGSEFLVAARTAFVGCGYACPGFAVYVTLSIPTAKSGPTASGQRET